MKKIYVAVAGLFIFANFAICEGKDLVQEKQPEVQIAILLDTSNSMDGLISQAKSQLWKIVNEFALAKQNGKRPQLHVALYEYGNDGLKSEATWIRKICPLTDDLDKISEELFALRTNGGTECCGTVIKKAVDDLEWSKNSNDLKMIFIAGNEPFTQGKVSYVDSCKEAIAKGITVNTIFCGRMAEGIDTKWKDGAVLADGSYINIDQNAAVADIPTPQDKEIAELGAKLNVTYVGYGNIGMARKGVQMEQDANAMTVSASSMVQRAVSKSSGNYVNASWDLVDAVENGKVKLEDVKDTDLPDNMKKMSPDGRKKYIAEQVTERKKLQEKIQQLNKERSKFIAEKQKEKPGENTLDNAVIKTVHDQAAKKNYTFREE
ncbi:MAG TPA: hypothetical protein DCZ94_12635 [Lentisphaeria bacterium]|nr:MAG: hypothetical protein A2X48_21325 [Lentisphaerae bacterium GWF2_49_21]HBC87793.1 hypothetical protein [Lentisphaeria bacterium]